MCGRGQRGILDLSRLYLFSRKSMTNRIQGGSLVQVLGVVDVSDNVSSSVFIVFIVLRGSIPVCIKIWIVKM